MKNIWKIISVCIIVFILIISLTACESSTSYGDCIDVQRNEAKSNLHYKISTQNVIVSVIFIETLWVPIYVLLEETYCPVGVN